MNVRLVALVNYIPVDGGVDRDVIVFLKLVVFVVVMV